MHGMAETNRWPWESSGVVFDKYAAYWTRLPTTTLMKAVAIDRWWSCLHTNNKPKMTESQQRTTLSRERAKNACPWSDEGLRIAYIWGWKSTEDNRDEIVLLWSWEEARIFRWILLGLLPLPSWELPHRKRVDWNRQEYPMSAETDG
jgi:hypothetical protein